jgi:hypothetical protein
MHAFRGKRRNFTLSGRWNPGKLPTKPRRTIGTAGARIIALSKAIQCAVGDATPTGD